MTNRRETTHASSLYPARRRGCRQSGFIGKRFTQLNSQVIEQFEQRLTAFANPGPPQAGPPIKIVAQHFVRTGAYGRDIGFYGQEEPWETRMKRRRPRPA